MAGNLDLLRSRIRDVPDFPRKGILFKDITPLLKDGIAFAACVEELKKKAKGLEFDYVVGIEARGFILGGALAYATGKGLVLARKFGKLPTDKVSKSYGLEYGTATLEMHRDSLEKGSSVIIIDDLLATGGTAAATADMVESLGAKVAAVIFLVELSDLKGREMLHGKKVFSVIKY